MSKKSLSERSKCLDDSVREVRGLLENVRRFFDKNLSPAADENRGNLFFLQKKLDAVSGEVAAEVAKTVPDFATPALNGRLDRHRNELNSLNAADSELLRELGSLRAGINAMRDLMRLFRERVDSLEIEYSVGAEAANEHDVRLLRFIDDIHSLIARYRNLERAIQALMMLEHGGRKSATQSDAVPRLLRQ